MKRHKTIESIMKESIQRDVKKRPVRIDFQTVIFVGPDVTDDEARENYRIKIEDNHRRFDDRNTVQRWK